MGNDSREPRPGQDKVKTMPQSLYIFGSAPPDLETKITTPTRTLTTTKISICWASWCDLIYRTYDLTDKHTMNYLGTSLNVPQQEQLTSLDADLNRCIARDPSLHLSFFGTTMHEGVRGFALERSVGIFGTPAEEATLGVYHREFDTYELPAVSSLSFAGVWMCSDGSLLLACSNHQVLLATESSTSESVHLPRLMNEHTSHIGTVADIQGLKDYCYLTAGTGLVAPFMPSQLVANATTQTTLNEDGRVYTRSVDLRYPACLGRPYTGTSTFELVPYLSETRITKIASGGYMTAAISEDGELFLWGQSNPGTDGDLVVLGRPDHWSNFSMRKETAIWDDNAQDEDVKCLNISINGKHATAYDVAIGFGHILVAVRNSDGKHVVFSAGCGSEGQLGLGMTIDFLEEFEEVMALRGKPVEELGAAGWFSYVVTRDDGP